MNIVRLCLTKAFKAFIHQSLLHILSFNNYQKGKSMHSQAEPGNEKKQTSFCDEIKDPFKLNALFIITISNSICIIIKSCPYWDIPCISSRIRSICTGLHRHGNGLVRERIELLTRNIPFFPVINV